MSPIHPSKRPSGKSATSALSSACASGSGKTAASSTSSYPCCPTANPRIDPISQPTSAPVHAVVPRDPQRARLDPDDNCIAFVKAIEIIHIHRETLDALPFAPGPNIQSPAPFHNALHVEAAHHRSWIVDDIFLRIEPPVDEQGRRQNPWQRNESIVYALHHLDFLMIARA